MDNETVNTNSSDMQKIITENQLKLKEERVLRKKEKKITKQLEKQKKREEKELIIQLQPRSNNVKLITRNLADKAVGNTSTSTIQNIQFSDVDFPELGAKCKFGALKPNSKDINVQSDTGGKNKGVMKVELAQFLNRPPKTSKQMKQVIKENNTKYTGNLLDSDLPERKRGKFREIPKPKRLSKLKQEILQDRKHISNCVSENEVIVTQASNICDNVITEELNSLTKSFVSLVVERQEKLYKRDTIKGTARRKYIVGLHETKKYLTLNKVKMLIIASDIQFIKQDGALDKVITQLITTGKANGTPYLFALKRKSLGVLTLKFIPVTCIAILNYEGLEENFNKVLDLALRLKEEYNQNYKLNSEDSKDENVNTYLLNNLKEALTSVT